MPQFHHIRKGEHLAHLRAEDINRVFEILEHLKGVGGIVVDKPASGRWKIRGGGGGGEGYSGSVTRVTGVRYVSPNLQIATVTDTYENGLLTSVGQEAWQTVATAVEESY